MAASYIKGFFGSAEGGSSSNSSPPDGIRKISDSVYVLSEPAGSPEMEIVFIHGLQLSDYKEAYWKTWVGGKKEKDGKEICWPVAWLGKEFPRARILSLCYDSSAMKSSTTGNMDGYILGESLVQEMVVMQAKVGQQSDCPIVFVCHSLGGIVVKSIVIHADARKSGKSDGPKYENFLQNIRGFHYYATPHDGSKLADLAKYLPLEMGKMVKELEVINDVLGRRNGRFEQLERDNFANKWAFSVIAEGHKTVYKGFSKKVVEETSARHGAHDRFLVVNADHFGVCKPEDIHSSSYQFLTGFISDVASKQNSTLTRVTAAEAPSMVQTLEHDELC